MEKIDKIREILKSGNHCMAERSEGHMRFLLAEYDRLANIVEEGERENERLREALMRIAKWDFDIMGDCVADAQNLATESIKEDINSIRGKLK